MERGGWTDESMRSKEFAHDYRYFPDPDLLPVMVMESLWRRCAGGCRIRRQQKVARFVRAYGIASYDGGVLTAGKLARELL